MIIIILTASYIWDDVRIVYALAIYDAILFGNGRRDGQGDSRSRKSNDDMGTKYTNIQ